MNINLNALVARLNPTCRHALERAAQQSHNQQHFYVEIEHLLAALLESEGSDVVCLLAPAGLDRDKLGDEIRKTQEQFRRGNTRLPSFSAHLVSLLEGAVLQSAVGGQERIRSAHLLHTLLVRDALRAVLINSIPSLLNIPLNHFEQHWKNWTAHSRETLTDHASPAPEKTESDTPVLEQYTQDLTAEAKAGRIDPIIGRDQEIRQTIDILLRRRQNNPILVGAPGVGKTAVAEGLARRIASQDVPPSLKNVRLLALDLGLLQAGAGVKGEFEQRLKSVIEEIRQSAGKIILFIDEAHTIIGAGGEKGQGDAANLLKPALARGELRTIAATTWQEYKKYFEKDPALDRRFQRVQIEEPNEAAAVVMLRAVADRMEAHHGVQIRDVAVHDAVRLSHRYITGRQLPDKAISVLDTACARVSLAQHDIPPQLEALRHQQAANSEEWERLKKETLVGINHNDRIQELESGIARHADSIRELESRWQKERDAVQNVLETRRELLALTEQVQDDENAVRLTALRETLAQQENTLQALRGEIPLVPDCVDAKTVAAVIAAWTGIPVGKMLADETQAIQNLGKRLSQRVIGQDSALNTIARRLQVYRAGLIDPQKPVGVFLLLGPTGVGKTETAYALADALYGGERNLISINLSEYQEAHTISQLKGAPPGYVGYGSGGVLTEAVRRRPYSVVLLDEIEKAHPDVLEAFYNVFDKGVMEDGSGLTVDFCNTVILATSNTGAELILDTPAYRYGSEAFRRALDQVLHHQFRPAFLARMTIVPYRSLDEAALEGIVLAKLEQLRARYQAATGKAFDFDKGIVRAVLAKCASAGARDIENVLMNEVSVKLAEWALG